MNSFEALGLSQPILQAITELGFESPTPVQEQAIPALLKNDRDFIGLAQTGTGKTAAFGLPLLNHLEYGQRHAQALVIAPTRELCMQITNDIEKFAKHLPDVRLVAVYGGASIDNQIRQVKRGVHVIVATPGRLMDLMQRRVIQLNNIKIVVLDEADEMLNMGFKEDIDTILEQTPAEKRVWLFSATMPGEVRRIANEYMTDPFELTVGRKNQGAVNIEHMYYTTHARDRYSTLKRIVDANPDIFGIVFCRTKNETQEVAEKLIKDGYNADSLHGDLSQQQRDKVMGRYRDRSLQLLIATDVAARGIDVNDITHVIHFNLPDELENYLHRSGRTARAGKSGVSVAIINMKEMGKIRDIERKINMKFTKGKIPTGDEICEMQLMGLLKKIHKVEVNENAIEKFLPAAYEELSDLTKEDLIKRMVSVEFNRFLEYYRDAPDLNADGVRSFSDDGGSGSFRSKSKLFINLGSVDGFDKQTMMEYIAQVTQLPKESIGSIYLKGVYSFIDMNEADIEKSIAAYAGETFKGRKIRVDNSNSQSSPGGNRSGGSRSGGGYGGGGRDRGDGGYRGGNQRSSGGGGGGYRGGSDRGERSSGGYRGGSDRSSGGYKGSSDRGTGGYKGNSDRGGSDRSSSFKKEEGFQNFDKGPKKSYEFAESMKNEFDSESGGKKKRTKKKW